MEKLINYENLHLYSYSNDKLVKLPRAVAVEFSGLGTTRMIGEHPEHAKHLAENGIIYLVPYHNPWAWMNRQACAYADEIIDVIFEKYGLSDDTPVISMGGSMGGQGALTYMVYAKRTPKACIANCPVCDTVFHFTERPDLPHTFYSALSGEAGTMDDALRTISPIHLAERMPKEADYHLFACTADTAVNIDMHARRFVSAMADAGISVTLDVIPDRGHCDLGEDGWKRYYDCISDACGN